jgi:hypothetical protein
MAGTARRLPADPDLPKKAKGGRLEDIFIQYLEIRLKKQMSTYPFLPS